MAGRSNASLALELMSGLVSDADTACVVLNHTSAAVLQHATDNDIESLFDNEWLGSQLDMLLHCLSVLSHDCQMLDSHVGSGVDATAGQSISSNSDICLNLLDRLCYPILDYVRASGISFNSSGKVLECVLSLLVSCFPFVTCEAQTKVSCILISLLRYGEAFSFHLSILRVLSRLYECQEYAAAFEQSTTNKLLTVIEELLCFAVNESFIGQILAHLVPSILTHCDRREVAIARLWSTVERCYNDDRISHCCFLVCGLADVFFMPDSASISFSFNLLASSVLWNCVQKSLYQSSSLTRKRAIFILRRALDFAATITCSNAEHYAAVEDSSDLLNSVRCLSQQTSIWQDFIILFETLEEKQVSFFLISHNSDIASNLFSILLFCNHC